MNKENWLKPVSEEDVAEFAHKHMNLERIMVLEEAEDINYGKKRRSPKLEMGYFDNFCLRRGMGKGVCGAEGRI